MKSGSSEGSVLGGIVGLAIICWFGYRFMFPENGEFKKYNAHPSDYIGKIVSIDNATITSFRIFKDNDGKYSGVIDAFVTGEGSVGLFVEKVSINERTVEAMKNTGNFKIEFKCTDADKIGNSLTNIEEK